MALGPLLGREPWVVGFPRAGPGLSPETSPGERFRAPSVILPSGSCASSRPLEGQAGDEAQGEGGTAHVERELRRGPLGPFSALLPLDSPFSTCAFPQGAWKWPRLVSLFHSGTKSFSAIDDLFWTSFFFGLVCLLHACGSPVGSTSEMLHPLADSQKQSQPRGASHSQAQMAPTGARAGEAGGGLWFSTWTGRGDKAILQNQREMTTKLL